MTDSGYTLVEMLVALAMVALVVGGFSAATQVLARQQNMLSHSLRDTRQLRAAEVALNRMFEQQGAYRSVEIGRFMGSANAFQFDCAWLQPCAVELVQDEDVAALRVHDRAGTRDLRLPQGGQVRFRFDGDRSSNAAWPPPGPKRQALRSVAIVRERDGDQQVIVRSQLWPEQPVDCQFDPILQDCR